MTPKAVGPPKESETATKATKESMRVPAEAWQAAVMELVVEDPSMPATVLIDRLQKGFPQTKRPTLGEVISRFSVREKVDGGWVRRMRDEPRARVEPKKNRAS